MNFFQQNLVLIGKYLFSSYLKKKTRWPKAGYLPLHKLLIDILIHLKVLKNTLSSMKRNTKKDIATKTNVKYCN